ncbi:hypothetical protein ACFLUR_00760 [Chloroflexota bacterium]
MEAPEEHDHDHEFIDIAESETIFAYAEAIHKAITLQFHQRGIALSLSYEEALELAEVMLAVKEHCDIHGKQPT